MWKKSNETFWESMMALPLLSYLQNVAMCQPGVELQPSSRDDMEA
jgi:hypothetical protein